MPDVVEIIISPTVDPRGADTKTKTKIIKLSKNMYDDLIFIKEANAYRSMSETLDKITKEARSFFFGIDRDARGIFYVGYDAGKRRMRATKATTHQIRVTVDVYKKVFLSKSHPDETLNNTIFKLVADYYEYKYLYRIFENDTENCKELNRIVDHLMQNEAYHEKILIERQPANRFTEFLHAYENEGILTLPLVLFYSMNGKLLSKSTGCHTENEVREFFNRLLTKKEMEKISNS